MHRIDDDFEFMKHGFWDLKTLPSDRIRRNVWVTCEADEGNMDRVFEEFPDSHVLMATDYPHYDSEFPHTVSGIRARSDLSAKHKEMILGRNAEELVRS
jgi:predicted TIM-barrel fold metal-dependent hydrolase